MGLDSVLAVRTAQLERLDEFTKLNMLGLLGQSMYEMNRGNQERALLYFVSALISLQSRRVSLALQGVLTVDHVFGELTGKRPLDAVVRDFNP